ncbi:MAG: hypothetical protein E6538_13250 [Paeniclostridium sordellii]|nr:hypothetical protein [Paeniclostridium sordellii]
MIDDLFRESISKSDVNIVFKIVNFRYLNKFHMIISSEKEIEELLGIEGAIGSSFIEMSKGYLVEMKHRKLNFRCYG